MVTEHDLAGVVRAALGTDRRIAGLARLKGGSKKGAYRLRLDDGSTVIVYLWDPAENYWPAVSTADAGSPFAAASGIDRYRAALRRLETAGVRTPAAYLVERGGAHCPSDVAVVEDLTGGSLEAVLRRDPRAGGPVLARLRDMLDTMWRHTGPGVGTVATIDNGGAPVPGSCEQLVFDRALADCAEAASRDERLAAVRDRLDDVLRGLAAAVRPRHEYRLVHGELGPDHVLVDRDGRPALIDIEGLMYADVEWEHAFLRLRFGEHYRALERPDLDPARMAFYTLAMHLSLVAGPLRLLDGDFPDRAAMREIAEFHLRRALDHC